MSRRVKRDQYKVYVSTVYTDIITCHDQIYYTEEYFCIIRIFLLYNIQDIGARWTVDLTGVIYV